MGKGLENYKQTFLKTASKEQVLLLLYQTAIKSLKLAIKAIDENNMAMKGEQIGKFQDIIIELNSALNFDVENNIAQDLSSLYDFLLFSSSQGNINIDKTPLNDCLKILNTLYSGWNEAIKGLKNQKR